MAEKTKKYPISVRAQAYNEIISGQHPGKTDLEVVVAIEKKRREEANNKTKELSQFLADIGRRV